MSSCQFIEDKLINEKKLTVSERETFSVENRCSNDLDSLKLFVVQVINDKASKLDSVTLKLVPKNTVQTFKISQEKVLKGRDGDFLLIAYEKNKIVGPYSFGYFSNGYFTGKQTQILLYDDKIEFKN